MITLFENDDLKLSLTGHDYDFVGGIEIKNDKPLTFFFDEVCDDDGEVYEDETTLLSVCEGLKPQERVNEDWDEEEEVAQDLFATSFFTQSKEEGWKGFLSDCTQRGRFLALVKNYCPERMKDIPWA